MGSFVTMSLFFSWGSAVGGLEMSLGFVVTGEFVIMGAFVVFSFSFIEFIACAVLKLLELLERQPKPKGPPICSKEGGGAVGWILPPPLVFHNFSKTVLCKMKTHFTVCADNPTIRQLSVGAGSPRVSPPLATFFPACVAKLCKVF